MWKEGEIGRYTEEKERIWKNGGSNGVSETWGVKMSGMWEKGSKKWENLRRFSEKVKKWEDKREIWEKIMQSWMF